MFQKMKKLHLERSSIDVDTPDNEALYDAKSDDTDFDGEKLNEDTDMYRAKTLMFPARKTMMTMKKLVKKMKKIMSIV